MTKIIADQPTDATSDAPGPEFLPLRGLADILTALLALVVAFICARLAIRLLPSAREACTTLLTSSWTRRPTPRSSV